MFRILISISVGVALGWTAVLATNDRVPVQTYSPKTPVTSCYTVTQESLPIPVRPSVVHQPTEVRSLERAFAHASAFRKKLALFELAGGAGSPTLQKLIFDANQQFKSDDRRTALLIFFSRLTELDPLSALAMAQPGSNVGDKAILQQVWQRWAIDDLESALQEAMQLANAFDRDFAAQSMLSAYGYTGNAATRRISKVSGITPNGEGRARYFQRLADKSPAIAFDQINAMQSAHKRREAINHLGRYLVQQDASQAAAIRWKPAAGLR